MPQQTPPAHCLSSPFSWPQPQHSLAMTSVTQGMSAPNSVLMKCLINASYTLIPSPSLVLMNMAAAFFMLRLLLHVISAKRISSKSDAVS